MRTRLRVWLLTALTFAVFGLLAWVAGLVVGDAVPSQTVLRIRMALLAFGMVAAAVVFRFLSKRWKGRIRGEKAAAREDKLGAIFRAARKRLAASPKAQEKNLRKLPTVLVLGPRGASKTTVVVESGLNTELLEGDPHQGDAVAPTEIANLWYAEDTVFVEAGGALLDDPEKWEALLSHTQPARFRAAIGLERQAPRVALVCVGCDEFTQPGAAESVTALARKLRERLVEASEALGIQLPVYVLFTRADRVPYYDDFVRTLGEREAAQALGATLPLAEPGAAPHAEAEGARVDRYLGELIHALRLKRREFLQRERDAEVQAGVYEFPRELEKLHGHLRRFLVELCRPSQLGRSPFLRGFHFTGVRALMVDEPGTGAPAAATAPDPSSMGATQVFDLAQIQAAAAQRASSGRTRRIPDWAFLKPFFRSVLMPDEVARVRTTGGARVDVLRRGLLTTVGLVGLVWIVGLVLSFRGNRNMVGRVEAASAIVENSEIQRSAIPSREVVERLDTLRAELAAIRAYRTDGVPMGLRWGLYSGERAFEPGLLVWLRAFETALGGEARRLLLDRLAGLPEAPDESTEFRPTYDALKAYLIMTDHPTRSTVPFLPDAVLANWDAARIRDEEWEGLLRRQVTFYAQVIQDGNPLEVAPEGSTVERSRRFLRSMSGVDQFYAQLLGAAAVRGEEIRLATHVPGSQGLLQNDEVVEPHFTVAAYEWVQDVDAAEMLQGEEWVLGEQTQALTNIEALGDTVKARYRAEYADEWVRFLEATQVVPFRSVADAAQRLDGLSDADSPLLGSIALVARNTRPLSEAFQPLLSIYPAPPPAEDGGEPDEDPRLVRESNDAYVQALRSLGDAVEEVQRSPDDQGAVQGANRAVQDGEGAVVAMADQFLLEPDMARRAGSAVRQLLEQPLDRSRGLLGNFGDARLNGEGASFCSDFNRLLAGYPFERTAPNEVSMDDLMEALKPGESLLSDYIASLEERGLLTQRNNRVVENRSADPRPTDAFVAFLDQALAISEALFDRGEPRVSFAMTPENTPVLSSITVRVDNVRQETRPTNQGSETFVWIGTEAREAEVLARIGDEDVSLLSPRPGTWALFRLFETADWTDLGGDAYRLEWTNTGAGQALRAELRLTDSPPIFRRGVLDGLNCVSRIVR